MAPTTGAPGLVARLDAHTVCVMNTPIQYSNEAFDILNGIADDAMSLALAAECVAPSYIEQCLHTVLQFHPYADRVKVAETSLSIVHGGIAVTYEIMPDEYVFTREDAYEILCEVAEEAVRLAGSPVADNITECANLAIRSLGYQDVVSVTQGDVLVYFDDGLEVAFELSAFDEN